MHVFHGEAALLASMGFKPRRFKEVNEQEALAMAMRASRQQEETGDSGARSSRDQAPPRAAPPSKAGSSIFAAKQPAAAKKPAAKEGWTPQFKAAPKPCGNHPEAEQKSKAPQPQ
eukprot:1891212-Amphidinium_carterae.1